MSSESTCFSFNMILLSSPQHVARPSCPFRRNFGRSGKGSFTDKAKIVDIGSKCSAPECTGYNLQYEHFPSPKCVPRPSYAFREKFGDQGKCRSRKKAKIVNRGCLCSDSESTCSKLQYDLYFFSVVCSYTELSISVRFGR